MFGRPFRFVQGFLSYSFLQKITLMSKFPHEFMPAPASEQTCDPLAA
jgi:hypothetical protein